MTPSLFDLPVRLGDTVLLAQLIFEYAEGKPLTDELRARIGGRAALLPYDCLIPHAESLERDAIHPSAYFLCVDGVDKQPLLLRIALSSAPSSGLFPKAILIGRTNVMSREIVINALPFGSGDSERIRTFSEQLNPAFLPKPFGARPVIRVRSYAPEETFPAAFAAFGMLLKSRGQNLACFAMSPGQDAGAFYDAVVWSAIRAGWRESYVIEAYASTVEEAKLAAPCTRFGVRSIAEIGTVRSTRTRPFDTEWLSSGDLAGELANLREEGYAVQSVVSEGAGPLAEELAGRYRAVLNNREVVLEAGLTRDQIADRIIQL